MHRQPVLILAHPGHELMVHGWLEQNRPRVSILTDGSGRAGESRIVASERVVDAAGADRGSVWAAASDGSFYDAILSGDIALFVDLATRLGDDLVEVQPAYVAGDAREGFNPTHDICRMIINAAVVLAGRAGVELENYAFPLFAPHGTGSTDASIRVTLDDEALARKVATARGYAELADEVEAVFNGTAHQLLAQHPDLLEMVDVSVSGFSERALALECLTPVAPVAASDRPPFYEIYGERLAAAGAYAHAIRYREHVQPIEQALAAL